MPKSIFVDPDKMRAEGKITFKDIPINVYKKSVQEELDEGNYTKEDLIRIFRDMTICREFEDMLNQIKTQARYADVETTYPGPAHLSLGQEAAAVGEAAGAETVCVIGSRFVLYKRNDKKPVIKL